MNPSRMAAPRRYVRPMQGWWRRDAYFGRYMAREMTAFAVFAYAVVLTVGTVRLAQGEAAWNGFLAALRSPWSLVLHAVLLVAMFVHARSWFEIMPKTMPPLYRAGKRVDAATITRSGWAAAAATSAAIVLYTAWAAS